MEWIKPYTRPNVSPKTANAYHCTHESVLMAVASTERPKVTQLCKHTIQRNACCLFVYIHNETCRSRTLYGFGTVLSRKSKPRGLPDRIAIPLSWCECVRSPSFTTAQAIVSIVGAVYCCPCAQYWFMLIIFGRHTLSSFWFWLFNNSILCSLIFVLPKEKKNAHNHIASS